MEFIPVNEPLIDGNEKKYLCECIDSGWISSEGPFVEKFESAISKLTKRKHAISVSSGTAALDTVFCSLDLQPGDEVILPSFTIISCVSQIIRLKAKPIFVDSTLDTWNMDVSQVKDKITDKTKAILIVHIYGLTVDIDPILKLGKEHQLTIVEDAAQAIGQTYRGEPCGSFGDISVFSFYANKNITTGEGGMILTNDSKLAANCESYKNLCFNPEDRFVHEKLGWNFRMTNMQAAIGLAQTERIEKTILKKRAIGLEYQKQLENIQAITLPIKSLSYTNNCYWVFGILINQDKSNITAKEATQHLKKSRVGTRPFFYPLHKQPVLTSAGHISPPLPNAEELYKYGFYIPSGLAITRKQIHQVSTVLQELFK